MNGTQHLVFPYRKNKVHRNTSVRPLAILKLNSSLNLTTNKYGIILIVAIIYDGLCTFEFGIACEVFGLNRTELGGSLYHYCSVALEEQPVRAAGGIMVQATAAGKEISKADLVVIPGWRGKDEPVPAPMIAAIKAAHRRGARLLSICSGAYVLAAAGLVSNRRVTTHWRYTDHFSSRFPEAIIEANSLYIEDGNIISSAGSSAGIDACLHIVRSDYGVKVANSVARRLVMHAHRHGGQAQFIEQPVPEKGPSHALSYLMESVRVNIAEPHSIASLSKAVGMAPRTFQRKFVALNGIPPVEWINKERPLGFQMLRQCVISFADNLELAQWLTENGSHLISSGYSQTENQTMA